MIMIKRPMAPKDEENLALRSAIDKPDWLVVGAGIGRAAA